MYFSLILGIVLLFYSINEVYALKLLQSNDKNGSEQIKQVSSYMQNLKQKIQNKSDTFRKSSKWTPEQFAQQMQRHPKPQQLRMKKGRQLIKHRKKVEEFVPYSSLTTEDPELAQAIMAASIQAELIEKASIAKDAKRPYVQKQGKLDFLIRGNVNIDHHVTVIPNDIYYNAQKACVNWLAECSVRGLRDKLIKGIRGPYR